jgi:hypothetical protein
LGFYGIMYVYKIGPKWLVEGMVYNWVYHITHKTTPAVLHSFAHQHHQRSPRISCVWFALVCALKAKEITWDH